METMVDTKLYVEQDLKFQPVRTDIINYSLSKFDSIEFNTKNLIETLKQKMTSADTKVDDSVREVLVRVD